MDPLKERDLQAYLELFRDEECFELQQQRLHDILDEKRKCFFQRTDRHRVQFNGMKGLAESLKKKSPEAFDFTVVQIFHRLFKLLFDITGDCVDFLKQVVDYMADYVNFRTENYHRLLVVMSQEVQGHLDANKSTQDTNSFKCRELQLRVETLEQQLEDLKSEFMTFRLQHMKSRLTRDIIHEAFPGTPRGRHSRQLSNASSSSRASSLAASLNDSVHRMRDAHVCGNIEVAVKEAQFQARLKRRPNTLDFID
jgi:hypothetical protein